MFQWCAGNRVLHRDGFEREHTECRELLENFSIKVGRIKDGINEGCGTKGNGSVARRHHPTESG